MSARDTRPCVYIMASDRNGTLYIGVTNHIARRAWEHRSDFVEGFTKRYGVHRLVYVEFHATMPLAIQREKQLKKWRRAWKIRLVEEFNPQWRDLYEDLLK
jgi:putative endonuclease